MNEITFKRVNESELNDFKKRLQAAFSQALDLPNNNPDLPIPPDQDIESSYYSNEAETYNVFKQGQHIGGVILSINHVSNHNHLDFFFINPENHSKGLGYEVWQAIEEKYPETEVWHTGTPYFEKRNIHFYINKCGFQINEFFCEYHPDPHFKEESDLDDTGLDDGFFSFIKNMKTQNP